MPFGNALTFTGSLPAARQTSAIAWAWVTGALVGACQTRPQVCGACGHGDQRPAHVADVGEGVQDVGPADHPHGLAGQRRLGHPGDVAGLGETPGPM